MTSSSAFQHRMYFVHLNNKGHGGVERFARSLDAVAASRYEIRSYVVAGQRKISRFKTLAKLCVASIGQRPARAVLTHINLAPVALLFRVMRIPYIVVLHGREAWGPLGTVKLHALAGSEMAWSVSDFTRKTCLSANPQLRGHRIAIVPLVAGVHASKPSRSLEQKRVVTISRLQRSEAYKGVDNLLRAWLRIEAHHSDATLQVIGDGDYRADLERLAVDLGLRAVEFLGQISDQELVAVLSSSRVFALPGRMDFDQNGVPRGEGFGIVFLEAALAGLPVIAGSAGGSPEAVLQGKTGLTVDGYDPHRISEALEFFLRSPDDAARCGQKGTEFVIAKHSEAALLQFLAEQFERDRIGGAS